MSELLLVLLNSWDYSRVTNNKPFEWQVLHQMRAPSQDYKIPDVLLSRLLAKWSRQRVAPMAKLELNDSDEAST